MYSYMGRPLFLPTLCHYIHIHLYKMCIALTLGRAFASLKIGLNCFAFCCLSYMLVWWSGNYGNISCVRLSIGWKQNFSCALLCFTADIPRFYCFLYYGI